MVDDNFMLAPVAADWAARPTRGARWLAGPETLSSFGRSTRALATDEPDTLKEQLASVVISQDQSELEEVEVRRLRTVAKYGYGDVVRFSDASDFSDILQKLWSMGLHVSIRRFAPPLDKVCGPRRAIMRNPRLNTRHYGLSTRQLALLDEILETTWHSGALVEIADFRASHPKDRSELDELVANSLLARDGHGINYRVDILGLDALATPLARAILSRGDVLAHELRRRYADRALRRAPYLIREIGDFWGVASNECVLTLIHFKEIFHLWGAGLIHDLNHPEGALAPGGESILDNPNMEAIIGRLSEWRTPRSGPHIQVSVAVDRPPSGSLNQAWPAIRKCLQGFSFNDIKEIVGLAGFDVTTLANLVQKPDRGATKGQLMSAIDGGFGKMETADRIRFLTIAAEEILGRQPQAQEQLSDYLSRLGWSFANGTLAPLSILDPADLSETPVESREDLLKAARRFRDGDLTGAISAACGAVDSATARIYQQQQLGDPNQDSFQQRCKRAAEARGVVPELNQQLQSLGWPETEIVLFKNNFIKALTNGAYVMQTLRSKMGDVHGSKPILKSLVFDSVKWAELLVGSLLDRRNDL